MYVVRRPQVAVLLLTVIGLFVLGSPAVAVADDDVSVGDTVVGEVVRAWEEEQNPAEAARHAGDNLLTWIEPAEGKAVRVPTSDVHSIPAGATVAVTVGQEVRDAASAEGLEPARDVLAAEVVAPADPVPTAPAAAGSTNQVTVVLVVPAGGVADTMSATQVVDAVNGPVAQFWSEQSRGAITVSATAAGSGWVQTEASCQEPTGMWNEAATAVGFTPGPGRHLMLYVTSASTNTSACAYGLAEVGRAATDGGRLYVRDTITSVIAHELGHNFGLGHSSEFQCNGTVEGGTCRVAGYNDYYDVMGYSWDQVGSLNAAQASRLGVLPAAERVTVTAGSPVSTYRLLPVASASGTRAIQVTDPSGVVYWLEYRQASGRDAWLSSGSANWPRLQEGVTVRRAAGQPDTSLLLDPTPSASTGWGTDLQQALPVGRPMPLSDGQFWVTVQSADAAGAVVEVTTSEGERQLRNTTAVPLARSRTSLLPGESLTSPNGRFHMVFQTDGNLVVYADGYGPTWASSTAAVGGQFVVQPDGNLVIYTASGTPVWASRSGATGGVQLVMQDDGNLVLYRVSGGAVWASGVQQSNLLRAGRVLAAGQGITSANGQFRAIMQTDGNLVVYRRDGLVISGTRSSGQNPQLAMQTDGNAVIYAARGPVWHSRTVGDASSVMVMQDDGNLVIYRGNGTPVWAAR